MENLTKAIELLESFGVSKSVSGILSGHKESYYVCTQGNGDKVIHLSDDVDLDGVFEEEKINGIEISTEWKSDSLDSAKFPIKVLSFLNK